MPQWFVYLIKMIFKVEKIKKQKPWHTNRQIKRILTLLVERHIIPATLQKLSQIPYKAFYLQYGYLVPEYLPKWNKNSHLQKNLHI